MCRLIAICFTSLLLAISSTAAQAEKTLKIGIENINYFPYYTVDEGNYRGYLRDLLDAFAKTKNYTVTYRPYAPADLTKALVEREVEFALPDNDYWSQDTKKGHQITYSQPLANYTDGAFVKKKFIGASVARIEKLGMIEGFNPYPYYDLVDQNKIQLVKYNSIDNLIIGLIKNEVNAIYFNKLMTSHYLFNMNIETLTEYSPTDYIIDFDPNLPKVSSSFKLSTTRRTKTVQELNDYLEKNWKNVSALRARYNITN